MDQEAPARRSDGTLKDASEIEWLHSPSAETRPLPDLSENGRQVTGDSHENDLAHSAPLKGLKGKEPANRVGGKRVLKPSDKVTASKGQRLSPKTRRFFSNRFEGE
jgi:hypothetical protein